MTTDLESRVTAGVIVDLRDKRSRAADSTRLLLIAALLSYVVSTGAGVIMRSGFAGNGFPLPFDQLLHAHSHTLYFGWAGLALLAGAAVGMRQLRWLSIALVASTPPLFLSFLAYAYDGLSIAVSTVIMFLWYGVIAVWWRRREGDAAPEARAMRIAFGYLVAASLGVWSLAVLQATETGTQFTEALAVHGFLIGFAWFSVIGVIALVIGKSPSLGIRLDLHAVDRAVTWFAAIGWMTIPLAVPGGAETPWIGPAARLAGVALLYPGWLWVSSLWRGAPSGAAGRAWRTAATWFSLAGIMSGGVAVLGTTALNIGTRQGVVIYLHVLFVGFVTTALVALHSAGRARYSLDIHGLALAVMVGGLLLVPLGAVSEGADVALAGSVVLWLAGAGWSWAIWRGST